jgi:hypothetical protein
MPDFFRGAVAPARLAHVKSFHLAGLHYHFTPAGGAVVLIAVLLVLFGGFVAAILRKS